MLAASLAASLIQTLAAPSLAAQAAGTKSPHHDYIFSYFKGNGVAADRPRGLAWLALAAERKNPQLQGALATAWDSASEAEHQQAADDKHRRFADPTSDFLAYLNLWAYLQEQQDGSEGEEDDLPKGRAGGHELQISD